MHESENNLDSLTQYENNISSSNLQIDSGDILWEEETSQYQINEMIVDDDEEDDEDEEEDEDKDEDKNDLYTKVGKEKEVRNKIRK